MRRASIAAAAGLVAAVTLTGTSPAHAHEGHASCRMYGATVAEFAQTETPFGQLVSNAAIQNFNHLLVRETHAMTGICEPR